MSEPSEIRVNLVFRGRQLAEFLAIKEHLGVQTNADVVRYLVRRHARALQRRERNLTQRGRGLNAKTQRGRGAGGGQGVNAVRPRAVGRGEAEAQGGHEGGTQRRVRPWSAAEAQGGQRVNAVRPRVVGRGGAEAQGGAEESVRVRPSELAHLCLDCPLPECDEGDPRCPYQQATGERERQRERTRAYMRRARAR